MALRQHRETVVVPAARGTIVDRNGEPLAIGRQHDHGLREPAAGRRRARPDARRRRSIFGADPAELYPTLTDRSRGFVYVAAQGGSAQGREAREARLRRPRLLSGGAALLPAGAGRGADPRVRGARQQGPRGARALARRNARRQARQPDDRQGSVRPRARRGRDEAGDARQGRAAHASTARSRRTPRRSSPTPCAAGARSPRPRSCMDPAHGRDPRDGDAPRASTRTASGRRARTGGATAPSPTRTSRARRSSS